VQKIIQSSQKNIEQRVSGGGINILFHVAVAMHMVQSHKEDGRIKTKTNPKPCGIHQGKQKSPEI